MTRRLLALLLLGCTACGDTSLKPEAIVNPDELFWRLELDHRAVLLAMTPPYNTLALTATPRNHRGEALAGFPAPQFSSGDVTQVAVSPDGVLRAIKPMPKGTEVAVVATLVAQNVKHDDTVYVRVADEDPLPMLDRLSIHVDPPDSAKVAATPDVGFGTISKILPVRAYDINGDTIYTIPGDTLAGSRGVLPVALRMSDTAAVKVIAHAGYGYAQMRGRAVGTASVYATTTALGVTRSDTIQYRSGWPIFQLLLLVPPGKRNPTGAEAGEMPEVDNVFSASDVRIGTGGALVWASFLDTTFNVDVTFADADAPNVASANPWPAFIDDFGRSLFCSGSYFVADCVNGGSFALGPQTPNHQVFALRVFTKPGTYEYLSSRYPGSRGRIVVVDER